ncbi:MAG: FAD-binding oxidoreductase [Solirubrobacterales bacterium]|nr:FAD-binding oxidoreductase [Solirubrobacterales bacterium]
MVVGAGALARPSEPRPELAWGAWGDPANAVDLPESILAPLRDGLGVTRPSPRPPALAEFPLPPAALRPELVDRLAGLVGTEHADSGRAARLRHLRGKSTPDLLRLRAADAAGTPDVVLCPADHDEVAALLELCSAERIAVVPFGGGTSVVGGLEPEAAGFAGVAALDLRRMDALRELDEVSRLAVVGPGLTGPQAEALLGARGYTIGHFPQSYEYVTLGGAAATRSSGQSSAGYGRFDDLVMALRVATPTGMLELGRAPKSAAGPDLRQLMLGSEGTLGVITELTVRVRPVPDQRVYEGWRLPSFSAGTQALRRLVQDGPVPTTLRLSDEAETAVDPARARELGQAPAGGCLAIVGYEGTHEDVALRREGAAAALRDGGGERAEADAGEAWLRGRFRGPYLRDALLDAGALVETLETATFWSSLERLHGATAAALHEALSAQGSPPVVLCHISHVYPAGASLYYTVVCAALEDPVVQWRRAKAATAEAILAAGGTISHHHAVGRDHRPWYEREIGGLGVAALRAVKAELDPAGILNPGILLAR